MTEPERSRATARAATAGRWAWVAVGLALVACSGPSPDAGQRVVEFPAASAVASSAADWPSYNRDLAGTRYSPLTEIDAGNVADLRAVWSYPLGRNTTDGSLWGGSEITPLVVHGVLYLASGARIVALHAERGGVPLWIYELEQGSPSRRGLAYWPGDGATPARLLFTSGRRLIALDAATGHKAPTFGTAGEIEMPVVYNGAPTLFENLLLVGSNSAPGSIRAFDVHTGAAVWTFNAVPLPGEFGHDSWRSDAWRGQPNVLHWPFSLTVDEDRALLYASFESAGPDDYYGGDRPGDTLFGDSIVALDARTGVRRWHFQTVHHDIWDFDLPAPPALLDVTIGGADVPVLAQAGKTGYLYVLNRVTGEPVFGIEERPVPQSDVPGEQTSPTQPIPLKPPPLARVSYAAEDLVTAEDTTPEHAQFCRELRDRSGGLRNAGPFTPYRYRAPSSKPGSSIVFPGSLGGATWGGAAADPALGFVFVNTTSVGGVGWIEQAPAGAAVPPSAEGAAAGGVRYRRTSAVGGPLARFWATDAAADSGGNELRGSEFAWPCQKPPWGQLAAVNAATGEIAWQVPLGITTQLPADRQATGRINVGGPIVTAGGLVFIGASNDRRFRAFDSRTGEELWSAELRLSAHAVPITYLGDDRKQYVAIAAAGASAIDDPDIADDAQALVVFALP